MAHATLPRSKVCRRRDLLLFKAALCNHAGLEVSHLYTAMSKARSHDGEPEKFAGLFLDFRKAYDLVSHKILLQKLSSLGTSPEYVQFVSQWLSERSFNVKYHGVESSVRPISQGLPQGSSLSVLLWQIYIYDFPLKNTHTSGAFDNSTFMDDICVLAHSPDLDGMSHLLKLINSTSTDVIAGPAVNTCYFVEE